MEEKVYFMPGEVVTLKQDIPNKPVMIVVKKETMNIRTHGVPNVSEDYLKVLDVDGFLRKAFYRKQSTILRTF